MWKAEVKEGDLKMNMSSTGRGWGHFYQMTSEASASSASACAANRNQMHEKEFLWMDIVVFAGLLKHGMRKESSGDSRASCPSG